MEQQKKKINVTVDEQLSKVYIDAVNMCSRYNREQAKIKKIDKFVNIILSIIIIFVFAICIISILAEWISGYPSLQLNTLIRIISISIISSLSYVIISITHKSIRQLMFKKLIISCRNTMLNSIERNFDICTYAISGFPSTISRVDKINMVVEMIKEKDNIYTRLMRGVL